MRTSKQIFRFKKGDYKTFKLIFDAYWHRLYAYAFKIYRDEAICEDITQEVFVNLWERNQDSEILNIESYLFRAIKYRVANRIRDLKLTEDLESVIASVPYHETPDAIIESSDAEQQIKILLEQLPPKCQAIFELSRFEHVDNATIAKDLNISIRTVETQISRALAYLRLKLPHYNILMLMLSLLNRF